MSENNDNLSLGEDEPRNSLAEVLRKLTVSEERQRLHQEQDTDRLLQTFRSSCATVDSVERNPMSLTPPTEPSVLTTIGNNLFIGFKNPVRFSSIQVEDAPQPPISSGVASAPPLSLSRNSGIPVSTNYADRQSSTPLTFVVMTDEQFKLYMLDRQTANETQLNLLTQAITMLGTDQADESGSTYKISS